MDLIRMIDKICEIAPDLVDELKSTRTSVLYSPPELMLTRWNEVVEILNAVAQDHPKREEIAMIISGTSELEQRFKIW